MSGIYLPNAQIPNGGCLIVTGGNEDMLVEVVSKDNVLLKEFFATPVHDHGRLIDADDIEHISIEWELGEIARIIAPTIIPADWETQA